MIDFIDVMNDSFGIERGNFNKEIDSDELKDLYSEIKDEGGIIK